MIIPSRNKKKIRELHAEYKATAQPIVDNVAEAAVAALLAEGLDAGELKKHAGEVARAVVALATLPPNIRAKAVALAGAVAPLDQLPAAMRWYAINHGRPSPLEVYGWEIDLPLLTQAEAERPETEAALKILRAEGDQLIANRGLITGEELRAKLGLTDLEWKQFDRDHRPYYGHAPAPAMLLPDGRRMWDPAFTLTDEGRAQLAKATTLTRAQAADLLKITTSQFDRLKKKVGLKHIDSFKSASGWVSYLYSLADVMKLIED